MWRLAISKGELRAGDAMKATRLVDRAAELARQGVDAVLLRERHLPAGELAGLARAVARYGLRVVVPGRVDVALAAGVDGVHLSAAAGELRVAEVRCVAGRQPVWVSVSCHTGAEVERARDAGADAVLFAPVFGKVVNGVEVVAGVGLERLREAVAAAGTVPVLALGGVDETNAEACLAAGARGFAGIRCFFG